jgi:NAD(P)H-dependent FMN reductase
MGSLTLLAISGSLRSASSNTAALQAIRLLAPPNVTLVLFDGLGRLPHFNPDLDGDDKPAAVAAFRALVDHADGLLISSPEYARGVPGSLKNGLDWLVGGPEFPGKPVALINTSPRATHAQASLALTLTTMSARLVEKASLTLPLLGKVWTAQDIASEPALAASLRQAVAAMVEAIVPGPSFGQ